MGAVEATLILFIIVMALLSLAGYFTIARR